MTSSEKAQNPESRPVTAWYPWARKVGTGPKLLARVNLGTGTVAGTCRTQTDPPSRELTAAIVRVRETG